MKSQVDDSITEDERDFGRVWNKIDMHVLPVIATIYLLSFLDQTSLGNARILGMQRDLEMSNIQYCVVVTVTYIPYTIVQLPLNLVFKHVGPNFLLPTSMVLWGIATMAQGVVTSYAELIVCRVLIGLFTGGVTPGLVLYLSYFFPRQKLCMRIAAFFSTASLTGACSGLLAYGIINMDGFLHLRGWTWIFILEGMVTVLFGPCVYILLPRSIEKCRFLSHDEKAYVAKELQASGAVGKNEDDKFRFMEIVRAFLSPQVVMVALIFALYGIIFDGLAYFTPSIVQGLGYTAVQAQLYSFPPFVIGAILCLVCSHFSDRYGLRSPIVIFSGIISAIGFAVYFFWETFHTKYFSLFLSIPGAFCAIPSLSAWMSNNSAPHTRRATATALGFVSANLGGITVIWMLGVWSHPPFYTTAAMAFFISSTAIVGITCLNVLYLSIKNRKKARIQAESNGVPEQARLDDKSPWFLYSF